MNTALTDFPPSQKAATARLNSFAPQAGSAYAMRRNFDHGAGNHTDVSILSPYVRIRMLDEVDVAQKVLEHHTERQAEKFLAEVFWRTYWKGWMELRPAVWDRYRADLQRLSNEIQTQSGLRARWENACLGQTGITPFDHWVQELAQTGYLHNHARMWFASIWIFTLDLPWQLGADFFLRHLLDGDAAVNTLSWRWVAGIQTRGKTYLASEENIAKFTDGRFVSVPGLAKTAHVVDADDPPSPGELNPMANIALSEPYGLLLHDDDVDTRRLITDCAAPAACAYLDASAGHSPWQMAPHVTAFRRAAAQDQMPPSQACEIVKSADALRVWARDAGLKQIVTPYAPVGPTQAVLAHYQAMPDPLPLRVLRRPLDTAAWPLATKGFFPFKKHIPRLIAEFVRF